MTRSSSGGNSNYSGLGQNYRDYSSALSFLGSNGSFFSVIHRLMHDPSHLYEFPVTQLPPGYHKTRGLSTITGGPTSGTIPLTAFEFYFYHFVSLLVSTLPKYSWNIKWQKCAGMALSDFNKWKKSWEPFRSCLLNSTANPAQFGWKWAGLAVLFSR